MKRFVFDSLLDEENICNLEKERQKILTGIENGLKLLVYGRRNTGKTSLVRNAVATTWLRRHSSGFFLYADLMGVKNLSQISERLTIAFSEAYNACFKMKAVFDAMLNIIKGLRPAIVLDDSGSPKLTFGMAPADKVRPFSDILNQLALIHRSNIPVLLVLDEFQDIAMVETAEALLRNCLERLDSLIPVVILGSKHHLLNRVFARPTAPFFNWGTHVHFETIDYHVYWQYMEERFQQKGYSISFENAKYLQDKLSRVPEAVNRLCFALLLQDLPKGSFSKENIDSTLESLIQDRRNEPETYLSVFTPAEQKVMIALSQNEPVKHPKGKDFIKSTGLTAAGVGKILNKLQDHAAVYQEDAGYVLADPLLKRHLLRFRL